MNDLTQFIYLEVLDWYLVVQDWPLWHKFQIVEAKSPATGNIFGFAEYVSTLALLLVVILASEFRYRFRLSAAWIDLRKFGFVVCVAVGFAILLVDVWYQNGLPTIQLLANPNNIKAFFGAVFLGLVFVGLKSVALHPVRFTKRNAEAYFAAIQFYILQGNSERLADVAEELNSTIDEIIVAAAREAKERKDNEIGERDYASLILLGIADRRFCSEVVKKSPALAHRCFLVAQREGVGGVPVGQFVRNIGQEFIRNTGDVRPESSSMLK